MKEIGIMEVGAMAARAMEMAIVRAVQYAHSAYGLMGWSELGKTAAPIL